MSENTTVGPGGDNKSVTVTPHDTYTPVGPDTGVDTGSGPEPSVGLPATISGPVEAVHGD